MNFFFVPSLQRMAATQIATSLWNRGDVVALIAECDENYFRGERWQEIEEKVNKKVLLLPPLRSSLRQKISSVVVPIGNQIWRWKDTHVRMYGFKNIPRAFRWTSLGTMDKRKTAEAFVRDPTLPEGERYGMACLYCLEWDDPVPFHGTEYCDALSEFMAYWSYDRTGDATALTTDTSKTPYQRAFHCAVQWGNEVAAEYYLRKLSPGERERSLSDLEWDDYGYGKDFEFYRFLLPLMADRQRSEVLGECAEHVLVSLLEWPWQQFFADVARFVKDTLKWYNYSFLLSRTLYKIRDGYEDCGYGELFGEFWVQVPPDHKRDVMRGSDLLRDLLRMRDERNVSLVLKDFSPEEREQIIFSDSGIYTCELLTHHDEWDALEFFVGECITSRGKMIHFKEECERSGDFGSAYFQFLDELVRKCGKNCGGEEAN